MKMFANGLHWAALSLCLLTTPLFAQQAADSSFKPMLAKLGDREVRVPLPANYQDMSSNETYRLVFSQLLPQGFELVGLYMADVDAQAKGLQHRYQYPMYMIATASEIKNVPLDDKTWTAVRPMIKAGMAKADLNAAGSKLLSDGSKRLGDTLGTPVEASARVDGKPELWEAADGSLRMVVVVPRTVKMMGQEVSSREQSGVVMMPVKQRLLMMYVNRSEQPDEKSDLGLLKQLLADLAARLHAANL